MDSPFPPGEHVTARAQRFLVRATRAGHACVALQLDPLDRAGTDPRTLIHPFDRFRRIRRHARMRTARTAHALRVLSAVAARHPAPWFAPRAIAKTTIDLLPHQFVAAIALVRGIAARVCVMDAVGTGKTMQAGIAIADLLARGLVARVLVIAPAHLGRQWAAELSRLGLSARVLDAQGRDEAAQGLPPDVSPWALPGVTIASVDLVKRRETLAGLEDLPWDLVVVDEAHGAASQTDRHDAIDGLARRAPHVILLTATPHDGDERRYQRLVSLGGTDPLLVVRRHAARLPRRIHALSVRPSPDEMTALAMLTRYRQAIGRGTPTSRLATNHLVAEVLARRAAASMLALARTAGRRRDALQATGPAQPLLFALSPEIADLCADDTDTLDALLSAPGGLDLRHERALLGALLSAALRAARADTLVAAVVRLVRRVREPVIVFAEHRDALVPLVATLSRLARVEVLHGGCSPAERSRALSVFCGGQAHVLLATDTAAEGLNLHQHCRCVVHLDTPWTAARMAQREGRVDRYGQARRVHAWRLARRGYEPTTLYARQRDRTDAADTTLAPYAHVPVLVTDGGVHRLPALLEDAHAAVEAVAGLRHADAEPAPLPLVPSSPERAVRSRLVAVDRTVLPPTAREAAAILVVSITAAAGPQVWDLEHVTVALALAPAPTLVSSLPPLLRRWRAHLATLRPVLDAFAANAAGAMARALEADEQRRAVAAEARSLLIHEARRRALAAHFVQRSLFEATAEARPPAAATPPEPVGALMLTSRITVDVPLLLVPVNGASDARVTANG